VPTGPMKRAGATGSIAGRRPGAWTQNPGGTQLTLALHCAAHIGIPGLVSWQCIPSQSVPVPVQGPLPLHWLCVASLMHLPLTGQPLSLVHQQHWSEFPQRS